ncbi:MAG TPA: hypothetical protein PK665_13865 [Ignavibacteriaceae bacterium]|nr:hypothetical protein [Candidatus Dojkabacteria bacterium]HQI42176.1 hypothetical protein [Ignavibacteriaceae bacterium]
MKHIANIAMIIAIIPTVLRIALEKHLVPEQVALILLVSTFFIAGGRAIVKLFAGIAALYLFAREITGGIGEDIIFAQLLQIAIALIGAYVMFKSLFPQSKRKKSN